MSAATSHARIDRPRRNDAGKWGNDLLERLQVRVLLHGGLIGLDVRLRDSTCAAVVLTCARSWSMVCSEVAVPAPALTSRSSVIFASSRFASATCRLAWARTRLAQGLGELVVNVRRADLGDELAFFHVVADVHQPVLEIAVDAGVRGAGKGCSELAGKVDSWVGGARWTVATGTRGGSSAFRSAASRSSRCCFSRGSVAAASAGEAGHDQQADSPGPERMMNDECRMFAV